VTEQSFTGYEDIDWYFKNKSASIYYSLWQGVSDSWTDKTVPLIIWLQGGPGGSSQFGCFNEVGPFFIQNNNGTNKPVSNGWAWNHFGHLLCVDQPIGVGFSINNGNPIVNNTP
jgi:carboxypeptidase C (cathepsin A)